MKKEFINKLYIAFTTLIIISIVICGISYLWDKNSINVLFVKDIFSIVLALLAPYTAIILFTDWKKQVEHEKTLNLLIEVSASFSKLHRTIARLELEDKYTNFKKYYLDNDLIKTIIQRRSEFNTEVDKLTELFDELDFSLKGLYLISERQDTPFRAVSNEYFKITYKLKEVYLLFLGTINDAHVNEIEYKDLINDYDYKIRYLQLKYIPNEQDFMGENDIPEFMSKEYLKDLKDKTEKLILDFKKSL
ncbi:TPA: hypothetical protein NJW68_001847 [Acinetobacter baumannii]|uniref:hypothetical protein n=1 Tax=Acinetobacter calcoaceticus/baumannii complex TaxID=909768 RepID=UPI0018FF904B|nr:MULTISPECIES: hypothetical protein [Acinetobacter calcoaceticus/baumannii complex]EKV6047954.1 hypothetical protein [Acinetobacter baumannii]ELY3910925.1 hypothetical protein [Acinetobacter baumannii]MBK0410716.1 hypothetical protein [Acinetobacter pittii]MBK1417573.1 hypothetical protein [Acinetobacter pittii]MDX8185306.1 hypothetical protein [Acinetobacter pittii]